MKKSPESAEPKTSNQTEDKSLKSTKDKLCYRSQDTPKPKKTPWGIVTAVLTAIFLAVIIFVAVNVLTSGTAKFSLDPSLYNTDGVVINISESDLEQAIADKKSFVLYSSTPACTEETAQFREYVTNYQSDNHISFYYLTSDKIKNTPVYETVKYYPSVILFRDGELKKYLDFESNADLDAYKSAEGFAKWFETYINLEEK